MAADGALLGFVLPAAIAGGEEATRNADDRGAWDQLPLPATEYVHMNTEPGGVLWIVAKGGLYFWEGTEFRAPRMDTEAKPTAFRGFVGGGDRDLYASTDAPVRDSEPSRGPAPGGDFRHRLFRLRDGTAEYVTEFYVEANTPRGVAGPPPLYVARSGQLLNCGSRFVAVFSGGQWPRIEASLGPGNTITCDAVHPFCGDRIYTVDGSGGIRERRVRLPGGGVECDYSSSPTLTNCTISANTASSYGAGMHCYSSSSPTLTNCILSGDSPGEIYVSSSTPVVRYCDVQGGYTGTGNLNLDPLFINAVAGDYHLGPLSPCIDAGDPASDFSLEPEPDGGRINMGAYGNTPEPETKGWIYIDAYNIVRKTRVGRTLFEYDLTTTVRNASSQGVSNLGATLLAAPANVQIIDGVVIVGDVPAQMTVESTDTFTIQVDRSTLVSPLPISWQVTYLGGITQFTTLLDLGPPRLPADVNCDGRVDFDDINPFVLALTGADGYYDEYPECAWLNADCNGDGLVDFDDINPFVELLTR